MTHVAQLKALTQQYLSKYGKLFICLSGASGAGKTHNAKLLAKVMGLKHIDQDRFFGDVRPTMILSNGFQTENWDCTEAIDIHRMSYKVHEGISEGVIFSGFACRDDWFQDGIDVQMHLFIDQLTCIQRRQEQKKDSAHLGDLIVREQVWPFYQETLLESSYEIAFNAMHKTTGVLADIVNYLINWLETRLNIEAELSLIKVAKTEVSDSVSPESFPVHYAPDVRLVEQVVHHYNDDPIVSHIGGRIYHKGDEVSPDFYKNVGKYLSGDI